MLSSYWVIILARSSGHSQDKFKTLFFSLTAWQPLLSYLSFLSIEVLVVSSLSSVKVKGKKYKSAISAVSSKEMMAKESGKEIP